MKRQAVIRSQVAEMMGEFGCLLNEVYVAST